MRFSLLLALLAAVLAACQPAEEISMETEGAPGSLRYLALGDSYTIGEGVKVGERWPMQLASRLREGAVPLAEPTIIARTGWTTRNLMDAIAQQYHDEHYDLVSLLIGVNNQYQGLSLDQYRHEFQQLLEIAIGATGGRPERVIVLSIPDWGVTPFGERVARPNVAEEIDAFNAANRELSQAAGVQYFDITPSTRPAVYDAELFAEDGLHPSAKMYSLWVEGLLPYVLGLFGS